MTDDEIVERFAKGEKQFDQIFEALTGIKDHLHRQDESLNKVVEGTESIVTMWNGGVTAVRFFCRLAAAWRFMMRQVVVPFGLPFAGLYGIWYVHEYGHVPSWLIAGFKFVNAAL